MHAALFAVFCWAISLEVVERDRRDPFAIKFSELSKEEKDQLANDAGGFFRKRLVAEADRRRVDPQVKHFLQISLNAWLRALGDDARTSGVIIDAAKKGELDPTIAVAVLKDRRDLLKDRYFAEATSEGVPFGEFNVQGKVIQIIDQRNMMAAIRAIGGKDSTTMWIEGVDTSGFFDDAELNLTFFATRLWQINGTKSYTNTSGAKKTVPCLKLHPMEKKKVTEHIDLFEFGKHYKSFSVLSDESKKAIKLAAEEAKRAAKIRIWKDRTGKFSVEAEYRGTSSGTVSLRKKDGKITKVPMDRLSNDDQQWIKDWQKNNKN